MQYLCGVIHWVDSGDRQYHCFARQRIFFKVAGQIITAYDAGSVHSDDDVVSVDRGVINRISGERYLKDSPAVRDVHAEALRLVIIHIRSD